MTKRCIINVATGEFYGAKQGRLMQSFAKCTDTTTQNHIKLYSRDPLYDFEQTGKLVEFKNIDLLLWRHRLPKGSKSHQDSPYGFKIHAMHSAALLGYTSLLWVDSPAYAIKEDISPIFEKMEKEGYYVMSHTDPLCNCVGDDVLIKFQVTRDQLNKEGLNLPSGSCYGFDLNHYKGNTLFNNMLLHEKEGLFFSKDGRHRHDEAVLALNMRRLGFPVFFNDPLFQSESEECVIKSGDGQPE